MSRLIIKNFRNITNIDIPVEKMVVLIGNNNSGKSNILRAVTLPFMTDNLRTVNKNLNWTDLNHEQKEKYCK